MLFSVSVMTSACVSSKYTTGFPIPRLAINNRGYSRRICQNSDLNSQPSRLLARSTSNHMWWPDLAHGSSYVTLMHWFLFLPILFFFFPSCFPICIQFLLSLCRCLVSLLFVLSVILLFLLLPLLFGFPTVLFLNVDLYCTLHCCFITLSVSSSCLFRQPCFTWQIKQNRDCATGVVYQTNMSNKSGCTGYLQCKHRLLGRDA